MYHTPHTYLSEMELTVRRAGDEDAAALLQLAALDSADPLSGAALVAEVSGRLVAALPLDGGRAVADPFVPTADIVALLELRASQLRAGSAPANARGFAATLRAAIAR
jgi:hypothetical protein